MFSRCPMPAANQNGVARQAAPADPRTHTQQPIVTGTSVLAIKHAEGVTMVADMLGSYGSMARFKCVERLKQYGDCTVVGAGGDLSDFQYLNELLSELLDEDACHDDNTSFTPNSIHKYVSRVMYNRRSKMDPIWNEVIVGGFRDGKSFLGFCDLQGTQYEDDFLATGFGGHLALPLLREAAAKWGSAMTKAQARETLETCMKVLFYRDCRAINKLQFAEISAAGVTITNPNEAVVLPTEWKMKKMVNPGGHE